MSLRDYVRKRRLGVTPEPAAEAGAKRSRKRRGEPIFVVQLHHARARHYDFRLEADGALKSWAVPKGPSMRAGERRLAVEVEDHPLDYADFHGDIPQGHYGAGHVDIFDRGVWRTDGDALEQIGAGKLDFSLQGEHLRGAFTLVRTKPSGRQRQWLLIKRNDEHARDCDADGILRETAAKPARAAKADASAGKRKATARKNRSSPKAVVASAAAAKTKQPARPSPRDGWRKTALALDGAKAAAMPDQIELQLATLREHPPAGEGWLHEVKWDGYRLLAYRQRRLRLESRNRQDWTERFPHLAEALRALPVRSLIVDGELIAPGRDGHSDFGQLQCLLESGQVQALRYVLFDLLYLDGIDLRGAAQSRRRDLLRELLATSDSPALAFSEHVEGAAGEVLAASARAGLEGIISKRADAPYRGGRTQAWIKLKHVADEEFIVVGHTPPKNSRQGFGSLLLAQPGKDGLEYVGRVGSGFDDATLRSLTRRLKTLHRAEPTLALPAHVPFPSRQVRWVEPELVVDVHSRGRGKEGLVRQASFMRLREDKRAADLSAALAGAGRTTRSAKQAPAASSGRATKQESKMAHTHITHPERIVFPDPGISKGEVADYYRAVERWLLPELIDRPISLLRCPDGIASQCFFQKHHSDSFGPHVHAVNLRESSGKADYVYVRDIEGVMALVQMNTLEFHPWGARRDKPDRPDRIVFDLDPAEGLAWSEIKRAAREVRDRLSEIGLDSWVRLSGGKGVHVCVPIRRGPDWARVKAFSEAFAGAMVEQSPLRYLATASKAARKDRIFIDWLRNARGATSVTSWSLRARSGAPVAMPLRWDEFGRSRASTDFDLAKAKRRASRLSSDPWEGFAQAEQTLPDL
ncbi:DNA ligase D [Lysobacter gummosus]|uniref:DNA ligase (ATP) n=1 Tax=Lysobacter gummosus TaxID=262324 RepID=A0ABY3XJF5_9GAMM|nr:DNA ligase D [Lysobacter gummosus]ALN91383.1 DNA ligase D [Lysobacter gummosus]UNP31763.1 DNA ligase D [Lysobacter gummosus]